MFSALANVRSSAVRDALLEEAAGRPLDDPRLTDILNALCEIPIHRGADVLVDFLRHGGSPEVRRSAVWALMDASAHGVSQVLAETARDEPEKSVRLAALRSLELRARPVDAGWLAERAADARRDATERSLALRALLLAVPRFAASDDGPLVQSLAAQQTLNALRQQNSGDPSGDDLAREAATLAHHVPLGGSKGEKQGGAEIGPRLLEIAFDEMSSDAVREEACRCLGRLRYEPAVERLLELVRREPDFEPDEDNPEPDPARRLAHAAAEALVQIDIAVMLGEPGTTAQHALARFAVETGCLVFEDRVLGPRRHGTRPTPRPAARAGS